MANIARITILFFFLLMCYNVQGKRVTPNLLDSIFCIADEQNKKLWHVESSYYFKGSQHLKRKNFLVRFASHSSQLRKNRTLFSEVIGHFTIIGNDYYTNKSTTRFDAVPNTNTAVEGNVQFLSISIYDHYMLDRRLLSPLCRTNEHYYCYSIDSVSTPGCAYVSFRPRHKHQQLVSGFFTYDRHQHYIKFISMNGDNSMTRFTYEASMGTQGEERFWPVKTDLSYTYRYYGNIIEGQTSFYQAYSVIDPHYELPHNKNDKNDLSKLYGETDDTTKVIRDSLAIAAIRPVAISEKDQEIYNDTYVQHRSENSSANVITESKKPMKKLSDALETIAGTIFENNDITLNKNTSLEFSHLDVNYSGSRGVTLREDIELIHTSQKGRTFSFIPNLGYYFRPKQFVWELKTEYEYAPSLFGKLSLNVGSRSITNSTDRLRSLQTGQIIGNSDDAYSVLFNERFAELYHSIEPINGLSILVGTTFRQRSPHKMGDEELNALQLNKYYNSFMPRIAVTYTPGMRYYIKNGKKHLLGSKFPTFTIDLERAMRHAFNTDSHYEKWEAEASQVLRITPIHNFVWKAGYGMFTNAEEVNFIGYRYFNNGVVDYNWKDQRSGVFQLLDSKYYYDSPHYFRMHFVFESPTLLLSFFSQRLVNTERLYSNTLFTEGLAPYTELGYGFSTIYCDFSFFVSYTNKQKFKSGVKFSLHL